MTVPASLTRRARAKNLLSLAFLPALAAAAVLPAPPSATALAPLQQAEALQSDCVSVQVRPFYPGQRGSEMYYVTDSCGQDINLDFATEGMPSQLVQLSNGMGRFTGWSGHVPGNYKFWFCAAPQFPSDPNNNPQDGPTYDATHVVCRN
jgi:hypothetical protein